MGNFLRPHRLRLTLLALAFVAAASLGAVQRDTPAGAVETTGLQTAMISGIVVTDDTAAIPVRRAIVTLRESGGGPPRVVATADDGRFVLVNLPAGRFSLSVTKPGWITTFYGAQRPGRQGTAIALARDERLTDLVLRMPRGAVITGRIVDPLGRPMVSITPTLLEARTIAGERRLIPAITGGPGPTAVSRTQLGTVVASDDQGVYRVYGLVQGTYVVAVPLVATSLSLGSAGFRITSPADIEWIRGTSRIGLMGVMQVPATGSDPAPPLKYVTTYLPGTTEPSEAVAITVGAGEERSGADVMVQAIPTARVEGLVMSLDGRPVARTRVTIYPLSEGALVASGGASVGGFTTTNAEGAFTFGSVRPGRYVLRVWASSGAEGAPADPETTLRAGADLWAAADVTMGGADVTGLVLNLQRGLSLTGRTILDSGSGRTLNFSAVRVEVIDRDPMFSAAPAAPAASVIARLAPDGTFAIPGLAPGFYDLRIAPVPGLPANWTLRAITSDSRDVLSSGFEIAPGQTNASVTITLTDRAAELSGLLLDSAGRPAPEYSVFAFPADRTRWDRRLTLIRPPVRPDTDGRYTIGTLLPGAYYVAALTDFDDLDLLDSAFLEQLVPSAVQVTLGEGERRTQDLRLAARTGP